MVSGCPTGPRLLFGWLCPKHVRRSRRGGQRGCQPAGKAETRPRGSPCALQAGLERWRGQPRSRARSLGHTAPVASRVRLSPRPLSPSVRSGGPPSRLQGEGRARGGHHNPQPV